MAPEEEEEVELKSATLPPDLRWPSQLPSHLPPITKLPPSLGREWSESLEAIEAAHTIDRRPALTPPTLLIPM